MIIGIMGKARSGKDTVAKLFEEADFIRLSFADNLKWAAKRLFGWDGKKDEKGRKLLIALGEKLREINSDIWIKSLLNSNSDILHKNIVISDVRYKNEADWIKSCNGILIKVIRIDLPHADADWRKHASETELDDYPSDYTIEAKELNELKECASVVRNEIFRDRYGALAKKLYSWYGL